jgi:prepilin-type processing-associated H-X9-DG protein
VNPVTGNTPLFTTVRLYTCPGDPSAPVDGVGSMMLGATPATKVPTLYTDVALTSYAANALVFAKWDFSQFPPALMNLNGKTRIATDITDGASNTMLFTERYANAGFYAQYVPPYTLSASPGGAAWAWWGSYANNAQRPDPFAGTLILDTALPMFAFPPFILASGMPQYSPTGWQVNISNFQPSTPHTGVINVAMADGSARTVSEGVSVNTWYAACTPASGDPLIDW